VPDAGADEDGEFVLPILGVGEYVVIGACHREVTTDSKMLWQTIRQTLNRSNEVDLRVLSDATSIDAELARVSRKSPRPRVSPSCVRGIDVRL